MTPTADNIGELWWARDRETGLAILVRIGVMFEHIVAFQPFGPLFFPVDGLDWVGKYSPEWMPANLYGNEIQQEIKVQ